jgi:hypothetical protein
LDRGDREEGEEGEGEAHRAEELVLVDHDLGGHGDVLVPHLRGAYMLVLRMLHSCLSAVEHSSNGCSWVQLSGAFTSAHTC